MGRDLLCKLHASIHCTPDGLFLSLPDEKAPHAFQFLKTAADCLYCWDLPNFNLLSMFTVPSIQTIAKTSPPCAALMSGMKPMLQCHCTAAFNPSAQYKQVADAVINQQQGLVSEQCLFVGPQGCAIPIQLSGRQSALFDVEFSSPHVTVAVSSGCEPKHLGAMVARCQALRRAVSTLPAQTITHLGDELYMITLTEQVDLTQCFCFA